MRVPFALLVATLFLLSCRDGDNRQKALSEPGEKLYTLRGIVLSSDAHDNTLRIDHEAIPGYMDAMTMDYSVRGSQVGSLPGKGSRVEAKLHVTPDGYWLTEVVRAH